MRRNAIREGSNVSNAKTASLAVWDVSSPVTAGTPFAVKIGAKAADGRSLAGCRVEVSDASGKGVASGALGVVPLAGTEGLYWLDLKVPAPATPRVADYGVRLIASGIDAAATRFSAAATATPEHRLTLSITEKNSAQALADVEVRLGPFHARTNKDGRAELRLCKGEYRVQLWRAAHIAETQTVTIDSDTDLALTMTFVPEDHPDARWVR
jgi:hypothetical protein